MKTPPELDRITDAGLAYRPKSKLKKLRGKDAKRASAPRMRTVRARS
jgi:hypothetical protein